MKRRTALTRARARDNIIILYDDDEYLVRVHALGAHRCVCV